MTERTLQILQYVMGSSSDVVELKLSASRCIVVCACKLALSSFLVLLIFVKNLRQ